MLISSASIPHPKVKMTGVKITFLNQFDLVRAVMQAFAKQRTNSRLLVSMSGWELWLRQTAALGITEKEVEFRN